MANVARYNHPWIDSTRAPLHILRFPAAPSISEIEEFCRAIKTTPINDPYGFVADVALLTRLDAVQRKAVVEMGRAMETSQAKIVVAVGVAAPSTLQRGIITLAEWVSPPKYPMRAFSNVQEATDWVIEQMAKRGLKPGPVARRDR